MKDVVIVSACRTAIGKYGGAFKDVPAVDLGAVVIEEAIKRAGIAKDAVDEVVMGNVLQSGLGQNPARQAMIKAGMPVETPAMTINKVCGSGLRCVSLAAQIIKAGDADVIVAGGMENMSQAPYLVQKARWGYRMGDGKLVDEMIKDGLWDAFNNYHMGITAENVAEKFGVTREVQDELAASSQAKAVEAIKAGAFKDQIVPVVIHGKKGDIVVDTDEFPREGVTAEGLGKLKPAFKRDGGTVTAGNASGINDGAAAFVVMSADKAKELGIKPLATIKSYASAGVDPAIMGTGPVPSSRKALEKQASQAQTWTSLKQTKHLLHKLHTAARNWASTCRRSTSTAVLLPSVILSEHPVLVSSLPCSTASKKRRQNTAWQHCASAAAKARLAS